ncbi:MAG TPA: isoprenylcysteine carboxylmethyltransferase family protein [Rhizomicrobium sp.]|nr:isoprenylcysteine carboxylmethyltransferase family protein [Rhizomicrobium sp.]
MIWRLTWELGLFALLLVVLLFWPAGTFDWWGGWAYIGQMMVLGTATCAWLYAHDRALLKERLSGGFEKNQVFWDKVLMGFFFIGFLGWLVLMALDHRWGISHMPRAWNYAGLIVSSLFFATNVLVFRANSFAAPVVKMQEERNQRVVTTGPYSVVRHPMYAGSLFYFFGLPFMFGSWLGLAAAPVLVAILMFRIPIEERMLRKDLAGYDDYAARVHYRLVPGIW